MGQLLKSDMDAIIDCYWPRTRSRVALYKMLQEAADLAIIRLAEHEATQEPVASYQLSITPAVDNCAKCGKPWSEHEFGVPAPYCP